MRFRGGMNRLPTLRARGAAAFEQAFARRMLHLRKTVELNATSCSNAPAGPLCESSPQARHHFTRFDQVEQLVAASEADADLGFMGRMMALFSLPRTRLFTLKSMKRIFSRLNELRRTSEIMSVPGSVPN